MSMFPVVSKDSEARCFLCERTLVNHRKTDSKPGGGSRVAFCVRCSKATHYDLKKDLPDEPLTPESNTGLFGVR